MKASEILSRFEDVSPVFGNKTDAWMRLVKIAAFAEQRCVMNDLFPKENGWRKLTHWRRAGLIEVREVRDAQNRRRCRIFIAPKGLQLLRLQHG